MKINYNLAQQFIARLLLISLCLQSCTGGFDNNPLIPTREEQLESIQTDAQESISPTNTPFLVGQTLIAQGGHNVTFYEEAGKLKADVKMNLPQGFSKTYEGLAVCIEQGAALSSFPSLDTKAQERRIHLQLAQGNQPAKVIVYKGAALLGGGNMFTRPLGGQNGESKEEEVTVMQEIDQKEMDMTDLIVQLSLGISSMLTDERAATELFPTGKIHHSQTLGEHQPSDQVDTGNIGLINRDNREKGKEKLKDDEGQITEQRQVRNHQEEQEAKIKHKKRQQREPQRTKVSNSTVRETEDKIQKHQEIEDKGKQGRTEIVHSALPEDYQELVPLPVTEKDATSFKEVLPVITSSTSNLPENLAFSKRKPRRSRRYKKKAALQGLQRDKVQKEPSEQTNSVSCYAAETRVDESATLQHLNKFKAEVVALEEAGKILAAAQKMDQLLKILDSPTLGDLSYALDLNRKAPCVQQRKNRAHQLAKLIAKHLNIDPQSSEIYFSEYSWDQLCPYLNYLIEQTAADRTCELRQLKYKVMGKGMGEYTKWLLAHMQFYQYPISISGGNYATEGNKSAKGVWDVYKQELSIKNYTHEELRAKSFPYLFHGGKLDTTYLNPKTFYDLIVRAGFKEEHFKEGKHGFQDKVAVKPIVLENSTIEECHEEVLTKVLSILEKAMHPYVVLVFGLAPNSSFSVNDLYKHNNFTLNRYLFEELDGQPISTIIETQENRLYLCFKNVKQKTLDLHHATPKEAFDKVKEFIVKRYNKFEHRCTIITGCGNHVNSNGQAGILHQAFRTWAKNELKPYIQFCRATSGNGCYEVKFKKPISLLLREESLNLNIEKLIEKIIHAEQTDNRRIIIKHQQAQLNNHGYYNELILKTVSKLSNLSKPYFLRIFYEINKNNIENGIRISWQK